MNIDDQSSQSWTCKNDTPFLTSSPSARDTDSETLAATQILFSQAPNLIFLAVSPEEKESWINALNSAITRAKNRILDEVRGSPWGEGLGSREEGQGAGPHAGSSPAPVTALPPKPLFPFNLPSQSFRSLLPAS